MNIEALRRLESTNQLQLEDARREEVLAFLEDQHRQIRQLDTVNTDNVERMVHVMPIYTVVREDISVKVFTRDELQQDAPETMDGYWQVPRLVE